VDHEDESKRDDELVEIRVDPVVQRSDRRKLDGGADDTHREGTGDDGEPEVVDDVRHDGERHVRAEHVEAAVCEIEDAEHAEDETQPDGDQEESTPEAQPDDDVGDPDQWNERW